MIRELLRQGESKTVELKAELPSGSQIAKTVCAFANRAGGQIILGVGNDRSIIGMDVSTIDDAMDRLANMIHDQVLPMILPEIYTYDLDDKVLVVIRIYPGNATPYYLKSKGKMDGTYLRVGAVNKQADLEMIQELERNRRNLSYDEDIAREMTPDDQSSLIDLIQSAFKRTIGLAQLLNMKLVQPSGDLYYWTHAADILLGKPEHCRIECARFIDESAVEFLDRKTYGGNLIEQVESAIIFLKNHLFLRGTIAEGKLVRQDQLELPEAALREAVINAVIHRDYSIAGSTIKIAVYDHRVDIISPGGLTKTITVEEIYAGRSEIRNKIIARIFRDAGLIEAWGSGVARMIQLCRDAGLEPPTMREDDLFVRLSFKRRYYYPVDNRVKARPDSPLPIREPGQSFRTAQEIDRILQVIQANPGITQAEIAQLLQISGAAAFRRLKSLQDQGRVRREGSKKTGRWVCTSIIKAPAAL